MTNGRKFLSWLLAFFAAERPQLAAEFDPDFYEEGWDYAIIGDLLFSKDPATKKITHQIADLRGLSLSDRDALVRSSLALVRSSLA